MGDLKTAKQEEKRGSQRQMKDTVPRACARGGFGVKPPLQLDILRKVHYLRKGD